MEFPPPHCIFYEALNDRAMAALWETTRAAHPDAEFAEVDAALLNSVEEFSAWFEQWITTSSTASCRVLLIWHAHCLSAACQQMLRRSMEKRSFRSRVWFHIEEPNALQAALFSRCRVTYLQGVPMPPPKVEGVIPEDWKRAWEDPVGMETELRARRK